MSYCPLIIPLIFQLTTWVLIIILGGYVFGNLQEISALLEGLVFTFMVLGIPALIFELSAYLFLDVGKHIKFRL